MGTAITSLDGESGVETTGRITAVERHEMPQTMCNLTVDTAHTFFVGEEQWLVHNTDHLTCWLIALGLITEQAFSPEVKYIDMTGPLLSYSGYKP